MFSPTTAGIFTKSIRLFFDPVLLIVLTGTLLRLFYALYSKLWLQSPDQLAWGAELDDLLANGNISYKQLIHYPHEGGSFFVSLLALCLYPFKSLMPVLSIAALLIDTLVRFIQARIAQKVFGEKVGLCFALFSVFSLPSLLPWSFVNFGLHAFSSVFPFLLLYFAFAPKNKERNVLYCGLLTGIAISFAFDNIVLVPAYLLFWFISLRKQQAAGKKLLQYLGFILLGLLPYLACRLLIDQRFAFDASGIFTGRDLIVDLQFSSEQFSHLYKVWYNSFPASFFICSSDYLSARFHTVIALAGIGTALILFFREKKKEAATILSALIVFCFVIIYSLSPLYEDSIESKNYVDYRHFSYILPLVLLLMIHSFLSLPKTGVFICSGWLLICMFFSIAFMRNKKPAEQAFYKPAGWILAKKYGDDPYRLTRMAEIQEWKVHKELLFGYGWGLSAELLKNKKAPAVKEKVLLKELYLKFFKEDRSLVKEGIGFSFSEQVTPHLDTAIRRPLIKELDQYN